MDVVIFDELQLNEVQNQLNGLEIELQSVYANIRTMRQNLSGFSSEFRYLEELERWEKAYTEIQWNIEKLKIILGRVTECYAETESRNQILVEGLSLPRDRGRNAGSNLKNDQDLFEAMTGKSVKIQMKETWTGPAFLHEDWVIQVAEEVSSVLN